MAHPDWPRRRSFQFHLTPTTTTRRSVYSPKVKLDHDVPLPNIVAWTRFPAAQPVAASARSVSRLKVPQLEPEVVGPTADVSQLKEKLQLPTLAQPSVVEPPLSPDQLKLQKGQLNMAQLQPTVRVPSFPCRRSVPAASATLGRRTYRLHLTCKTCPARKDRAS